MSAPASTLNKESKIVRKFEKGKIIEINVDNLIHNIGVIRSRLSEGVKIFPVLKSNAYGHDITTISQHIEGFVDGWCVANLEEAEKLWKISKKPILIMKGTLTDEEDKEAVSRGFWVVVRDEQDLNSKIKKGVGNLFLKVDTGMGRLGVLPDKLKKVLESIKKNGAGQLFRGVMSHFAYSDLQDRDFVNYQFRVFSDFASEFEKAMEKRLLRTLSNSAASLSFKDAHFDFIRPGIAIYGISPFGKDKTFDLKPVLTVKTKVIAIKSIPKDWSVGYSRKFIAKEEVKIAILDVGYSSGIPRSWWEKGYVYAGVRKLKIVGLISMDMMAVLIDNVDLSVGDEVIILGDVDGITAYDIASSVGSIPYEILCSFGLRS
ncbi:Alanine racemase, catabolic [bacterium HR19]|nr:Alanine racemase, catabolic [bacterium HR19]